MNCNYKHATGSVIIPLPNDTNWKHPTLTSNNDVVVVSVIVEVRRGVNVDNFWWRTAMLNRHLSRKAWNMFVCCVKILIINNTIHKNYTIVVYIQAY